LELVSSASGLIHSDVSAPSLLSLSQLPLLNGKVEKTPNEPSVTKGAVAVGTLAPGPDSNVKLPSVPPAATSVLQFPATNPVPQRVIVPAEASALAINTQAPIKILVRIIEFPPDLNVICTSIMPRDLSAAPPESKSPWQAPQRD
jgi:hypothetical protein